MLLAPAAASMDMFADYGARGDAFVERSAPARRGGVAGEQRDRTGPRAHARRHGPRRPVAGSARFDSPRHRRTTCSSARRWPCRLRADHGLLRLERRVAARRPGVLRDLPPPARCSRSSALRRARRRLAVPVGLEAPRLPDAGRRSGCAARAVIPFGKTVNGNRNWLALGPGHVQPSEFAKVGARARRRAHLRQQAQAPARACCTSCVPYLVPVAALVLALVLAGHDLGTAMVILVIVAAVLFVAGAPMRSSPSPGLARPRWASRPHRHEQPTAWAASPTGSTRLPHRPRRPLRPVGPRPVRPRRRRLVGRRARREPRRSGPGSPRRTTTSSSRSSARSSGCPAPSLILLLFAVLALGLLPPGHPHPRPLRAHRRGRHHGLADRPGASSTSAPSSACFPVIGVPLPLVSRAAPRSSRPCSPSASCCPSRAPSPVCRGAARRAARPAAPLARGAPRRHAARAGPRMTSVIGRPPQLGPARGGRHAPVTSRRCSPSPTACAGATPTCGSPRSAPRRASRRGSCPSAATDLRLVPKVPLPRRPVRRPAPAARAACARAVRAAGRRHRRDRAPRSSSASAATSARPPTSPPGAAACRSSCTSRTPGRASPTASGPGWAPHVATTFAGTPLPHAPRIGMPLRREIATLDRAARRAEARARFGLDAGPPDAARHRRLARRPAPQRRPSRRASAPCARRRRPGAARHRPRQGRSTRRAAPRAGPRTSSSPYADRMELAYAAADLVVCRARAPTRCAS